LKERLLPNFFIVGAAKAGTTSFAEYLGQHPQIFMSPVKEPHYFSSDIDCARIPQRVQPEEYFSIRPLQKRHALCIRLPEQYEQLFASAGGAKAVGEASPSYLYSDVAPRRIAAEVDDPRVLIFVRNPVLRAYSHFQMDITFKAAATDDFLRAVEIDWNAPHKGWGVSHLYVELGLYVPQLKRYLARLPADRVKICLQDDYRQDARRTLLEILSFLGVEQRLDGIGVDAKHGQAWRRPMIRAMNGGSGSQSGTYRILRKAVPTALRPKLKTLLSRKPRQMRRHEFEAMVPHFREDVRELSSMLRRDLSHWLVPPPGMLKS
jgi:hypothetical protein